MCNCCQTVFLKFFLSSYLVVQLVKSKDNIKRLRLKIESKPARDFEFDDGKVRRPKLKGEADNTDTRF